MLGKNIAEITQYKMSFLAVPHMPCVHVLFEKPEGKKYCTLCT